MTSRYRCFTIPPTIMKQNNIIHQGGFNHEGFVFDPEIAGIIAQMWEGPIIARVMDHWPRPSDITQSRVGCTRWTLLSRAMSPKERRLEGGTRRAYISPRHTQFNMGACSLLQVSPSFQSRPDTNIQVSSVCQAPAICNQSAKTRSTTSRTKRALSSTPRSASAPRRAEGQPDGGQSLAIRDWHELAVVPQILHHLVLG